jgi:hypothetical protein
MKRKILVVLLIIPFFSKAITITSTTSGGSWFSTSTWIGGQIPGTTDNAVINGPVTIPSLTGIARNLTINTGKTLTNNSWLLVVGTFTNNGTLAGTGTYYHYTGNTVTSTTTGGDWNTAATWVGGLIPNPNDNVVINGPVTVSTSSPQQDCFNLTINSGKTLTIGGSGTLFCWGMQTNNGTFAGSGTYYIRASGMTVLSGTGTFSFTGSYIESINSPENDTIASNVEINALCLIQLATAVFGVQARMVNMGDLISIGAIERLGTVVSTWINGNNSYLGTNYNIFYATSGDTLYASSNGNTILFAGTTNYNIIEPVGDNFFNLEFANTGIKALTYSPIVQDTFCMFPGGTLNMAGYNMTVGGSWINKITSGSLTNNTGTVTFNGIASQILGPTVTTFKHLTVSASSNLTLGVNTTINGNLMVNNNSTLDCEAYQVTGNSTGTFTLGSGSTLELGSTSSVTVITFPTNFTTANTTLNSTSTVTYQSNANQTISSVPSSYGNLILSTGSSSTTKTPASSPLAIAGNLTINSNSTLSGSTGTINLTGNLTNAGALSFSSGALNIGGNLTNNGTFTYGTSNTTFNGSLGQAISGSTYPTFYNMTVSEGNGKIVSLGGNQTVINNLSLTSGSLDVTSSNYNLSMGGNFSNNGGIFVPHHNTVTLNGSSSQTLGGSSITTFYNLTLHDGHTVTLGNNETVTGSDSIYSSTTLDVSTSNYNMIVGGNWVDNGTFIARSGLVTFNANGSQCVIRSSGTENFKNMTVASTSRLGSTSAINVNGLVTIQPGGRMDCSCP